MREAFRQVWSSPYVRVLLFVLLFFAFLLFLQRAWPGLRILLFAFAFAYLAHPLVRLFETWRIPRALGVALVYLGLGLFLGLISFLAAQTVRELSRLVQDLPQYVAPAIAWLSGLPQRVEAVPLPPYLAPILAEIGENLEDLLQGFLQTLLGWLRGLLDQGGSLLSLFTGLLGGVFQLFTALIVSAYFLYDLPRLGRAVLRAFPEPYQPLAAELFGKLDRSVGGFIRSQLLVAFLVGLMVGVGLSLVGVPLAASLGFLAGVFNLIPYVGPVVAGIPAVLLAATEGWLKALLALLVLWLANQVEASVLGPLIVARATRLHPVTAIAGILVGVSLFGLWGALLGVPVAAFLKVLVEDYYQRSRFYREG
ncbi:AI-2E family transporter [Thermus sediminis]|uniref:AI-2E family transporter n=1 Tax=Thermus sediminis TaxID=1761908 RepID=UPI000E3E6893|nr:AI-2E family transporter [Thermus sediminis]